MTAFGMGLSPRVRGKRNEQTLRSEKSGSIPACAGEAVQRDAIQHPQRVYPRVCGGSIGNHGLIQIDDGLSPRVRGKRWLTMVGRGVRGSIPACAGEAQAPTPQYHIVGSIPACAGEAPVNQAIAKVLKVYPRVCGGSTGW